MYTDLFLLDAAMLFCEVDPHSNSDVYLLRTFKSLLLQCVFGLRGGLLSNYDICLSTAFDQFKF
jgi:hypothetical protein